MAHYDNRVIRNGLAALRVTTKSSALTKSASPVKISSEQKADIVRRIQVKNPDGTWAVSYKALAPEFGVSSCLISHIAKHAGLPQRKRGKYVPSVGKRYQPPARLSDMYQELRSKVGVTQARRLIDDHMRIRGISYEDVGRGSFVDDEPIAA